MGSFEKVVAALTLMACSVPFAADAKIVISSDPTHNMICTNGSCGPTHENAVLNVTDLLNMLSAGNVTIGTFFFSHGHYVNAAPIDINVPLSWANANTLLSDGNTIINAPITIMGSGALTVDGSVEINASITVMGPGALSFENGFGLPPNVQITYWDLNGKLIFAGTSVVLAGDVPTLVSDIAATGGKGDFALANDTDARNDVFHKAPIPDFQGDLMGLGHTIANLKIKKGHFDCEGLVSKNEGYVHDIRLQAVKVTSTTQKYVGAIAGCNYGSIGDVSVDGTVTGNENAVVGGIAGANLGANGGIGLARAAITVSGGQAGGIVGENDTLVDDAYATGSVTGQSNTGGLVGANKGIVQDSYATTAVSGNDGTAGGLAGFNSTSILDCYSTGLVGGTGYVGGFVGYDPNKSVSNGYWDLDTSGFSDPNQGSGFPKNDPSPVGLTTAQLQSQLPTGFDKRTWGLDANINNGFPYLRYFPPQ